MLLLGIRHSLQRRESDCLVACSEMVLDYLQVPNTYEQLHRLLNAQSFGTVFSRLQNLETLGLVVSIDHNCSLQRFLRFFEVGLPVIVPINTWSVLHWNGFETDHAVVMTGIDFDNELVYIHDPFFEDAPIALSYNEFEPAWTEHECQYAVIALNKIE